MKERVCELCNQRASLYCPSDSAFLCFNCDATVHSANFLVARHLRHLLCSKCDRFAGIHASAVISRRLPSNCRSCSPENPYDDADSLSSPSSSSSFACVSSSESCATAQKKIKAAQRMRSCSSFVTEEASPAAKKRRINVGLVADEVFGKWSRELGLGLRENGKRVASYALSLWLEKWKCVPLRVAAASSFWLGLRFCGDATFQNLLRLEAISGVPAKLIVAAHANVARVITIRRELKEGWDESS